MEISLKNLKFFHRTAHDNDELCGIFGCVLSDGSAAPVIHKALERLEYRGYDSVGEATVHEGRIHVKKAAGKIRDVHKLLNLDDLPGSVGIGHTRWATHGAPTDVNAHPHVDCDGVVAVVHNGIIENFSTLKAELEEAGHTFKSKTDTEVIPHLIEHEIKNGASFVEAVRRAVLRLDGSYAIAVLYAEEPDKIVCAKKESPLVVGVGDKSVYCASDVPAFLPLTNRGFALRDGEMAVLRAGSVEVYRIEDMSPVEYEVKTFPWTPEMAEKQGYPHFMLKEIHEQPTALRNALRLQETYLDLMTTFLDRAKTVYMVACGTSYHACLAATYMFSKLAYRETEAVIASEFIDRYGNSVNVDSAVLAVSQSGETADTLKAVMYARDRAATILGITNVLGSTLTRVARVYLCQQSGPEIGVAATKTFTAQLMVLAQLAMRLGLKRGKIGHEEHKALMRKLRKIPDIVEETIRRNEERVKALAEKYHKSRFFLFLGRGISSATAAEGNLKMLEITYIPSITYPAGESKHGPISLVEEGVPIVFVCPNDSTKKAALGNMMELKARGGRIIAVMEEGDEEVKELADDYVEIPKGVPEVFTPIPYVVPLQMFAYYTSVKLGLDPDKPRNLAKSVTVL